MPGIVRTGNGDPTEDLGQNYGQYLDQAVDGHYWTWAPGGPWVDTGIPLTGPTGLQGENGWTITTANFTMPSIGSSGVVNVVNGNFEALHQRIFMYDPTTGHTGYFRQFGGTPGSPVTVTVLKNEATTFSGQAAPGNVFTAGTLVTTAGEDGATGDPGTAAQVDYGNGPPVSPPTDQTQAELYIDTDPGGHYWLWDVNSLTWTDTGAQVTGNQGDPGTPGADGHTPATTMSNSAPSGGADGDLHFQQINGGLILFWKKAGGIWSAGASLLSSRLISTGAGAPSSGAGVNVSDTYLQAADPTNPPFTMWYWNGTLWQVLYTIPAGGGGGGSQTFSQTAANSTGQLTGSLYQWNMETSIQYVPHTVSSVSPGATIVFNPFYQWTRLALAHNNDLLNYSDPVVDRDCFWKFQITNITGGVLNFAFVAGRWTANEGITVPDTINAGQTISLICRYTPFDGTNYMNIVLIEQNQSIL